MTPIQALRSFLLAQSFGHGWATQILHGVVGDNYPEGGFQNACTAALVDGRVTRAVIANRADLNYAIVAVEAAHEGYDGGLRANFKHTTGGKTLSWSVAPDGTVRITVRAGPSSVCVIAAVTVSPDGETRWQHIAASPMKGKIAGRDGRHVNAADGWPLPGSDEYAYEVAARAVRAIGGRVETQPLPRRLPHGRRGLASVA